MSGPLMCTKCCEETCATKRAAFKLGEDVGIATERRRLRSGLARIGRQALGRYIADANELDRLISNEMDAAEEPREGASGDE